MKTLIVACLLVGMFLLGAYADHLGGTPDWHGYENYWDREQQANLTDDQRIQDLRMQERANTPDWHSYVNYWKWQADAGTDFQTPNRAPLPAAPAAFRYAPNAADSGPGSAAQDCVPTLLRQNVARAEAYRVCGILATGRP